ncbi:hypothetical protein H9S92_18435, partial [Lewinella lacunae]
MRVQESQVHSRDSINKVYQGSWWQDALDVSFETVPPGCGAVPSGRAIKVMDSLQSKVDAFTQWFASDAKLKSKQLMTVIPVRAHIIRQSNGSGGLSIAQWNTALANLNALYAPANIQFVECGAPNIIQSSTFYNFSSSQEASIYNAHGVEDVLNIFIPGGTLTADGNDLCGYAYFPWSNAPDLLVTAASCMTSGNTFAHEVGHYLGLYHTHGKTNCEVTDELVNGVQCNSRGDNVCDTPADPNLQGPNCSVYLVNTNCVYVGNSTDANGQLFNPNPRNIMSYSRHSCRDFFSPQQLARAAFYAANARNNLVCSTGGSQGLTMATSLALNPSSVASGQNVQFSFNVRNTSSTTFNGQLFMTINETDGSFVEALGVSSVFSLCPNCTFSSNYTGSFLMDHPARTYRIVAWYRPTGTSEWTEIADGNFSNESNLIVTGGTSGGGSLRMNNNITLTPNPIIQNQAAQATFTVRNAGSSSFNGDVSIDLYQGDNYLGEIQQRAITSLSPNSTRALTYNFTLPQTSGTYQILAWFRPNGGDWAQVEDGSFNNGIEFQIVAPAASTLTVSTNQLSPSATSTSGSFDVAGNCTSWSANSTASWITLSPSSGTGPRTVNVTYTANTSTSSRTGTITVSGCNITRTITVTQAAAASTLTVSTTQLSPSATTTSGSFNVAGTCTSWSASDNAGWITLSPSSGTGPRT